LELEDFGLFLRGPHVSGDICPVLVYIIVRLYE